MKSAPLLLTGIILFYVFYNKYTFAGAFRYAFDMGFNIGMGDGNLDEDDASLFVTTAWMLLGYFVVFNWWLAIVQTIMGNESLLTPGHKKIQSFSKWLGLTPTSTSIIVTTVWGLFGVTFGVLVEEWSILKSVNFAVGGMTTTGSQLVSNTTMSNTLGGIFVLFGVPLLSITMTLAFVPDKKEEKVVETKEENSIHF